MIQVTLQVDALDPRPGGIGRYTWELCKGLLARSDVAARFYGRQRFLEDPARLMDGRSLGRSPGRLQRWIDRRALRSSLVHGPNYFLPGSVDHGIITVHDLSVFRFPETHPADRVLAFEREFLSSLARAAHVLTDTETVRHEVIADFNIAPERVTAIPLGVDESFAPLAPDALAPRLAQWSLTARQYGLCVSTLEPRKKTAELLSAWRKLPPALRDRFPLVLAGGAGWRNEALMDDIARAAAEGWLRFLGFVDETHLPALYAGAALFVYPSIYEGFGLPPLEAMASGVPTLISNRSCMPEVCGPAARYVDPDDADGFVSALEDALADEEWRRQASIDGPLHAATFQWRTCVDRTVEIYRQVALA